MLGYFDMRVLSEKVWLPVADRVGDCGLAMLSNGNSCNDRLDVAAWPAITVSTVISYV